MVKLTTYFHERGITIEEAEVAAIKIQVIYFTYTQHISLPMIQEMM